MNLFNKKTYLLLMLCFAFVSMNAQQSDNNDQPLPTDVKKNTYVADPAKSDNGDVAPEGHVSKNTYVADPANSDNGDGVDQKAETPESNAKTTTVENKEVKTKVTPLDPTIYAPDGSLLIPQKEVTEDVTKQRVVDAGLLDANNDGISDAPSVQKPVTKQPATTTKKVVGDANGDGVIDNKEN